MIVYIWYIDHDLRFVMSWSSKFCYFLWSDRSSISCILTGKFVISWSSKSCYWLRSDRSFISGILTGRFVISWSSKSCYLLWSDRSSISSIDRPYLVYWLIGSLSADLPNLVICCGLIDRPYLVYWLVGLLSMSISCSFIRGLFEDVLKVLGGCFV